MREYVEVLRRGGVVACPTETQMGLLADALSGEAVARVVAIKRRPAGEPIALIAPDLAAAERIVVLTPAAVALARAHWPGPLTLVALARPELPAPLVLDGKVGVRVPGPSPALDLARAFGGPLTATSANRSGEPATVSAAETIAALGTDVDAVVPGRAPGGPPSTVVDVTVDPPRVIRRGAVDLTPSSGR
jgi:L-threonylcarbamoyladenylate synthase